MAQMSVRLMTVAQNVPRGLSVADIGSDHGMLPIFLVESGIASRCVAVEVSPGPFHVCSRALSASPRRARLEVRLGDGLSPISPGEVDVVCVSGMGGGTIAGILSRGEEQLKGVQRLVLQPNGGDGLLRRHLYNSGWELVAEFALEEKGRFYAVVVAEPGAPTNNYRDSPLTLEVMMEAGPFLIRDPSPAHRRRWLEELAHLERIASNLRQHASARNLEKLAEVLEAITSANAVLELLSGAQAP